MQILPYNSATTATAARGIFPGGNRSSAFTIAEVMISICVIGVSALALFSCFSASFFNMDMARQNQRATQIMLDKTETIRLYNWDQVNSNGFVALTFTNKYDPLATNNYQGISYQGTVTISNAPYNVSYSNDLKMLTVTLKWQTGRVQHTRQCTTLIGRNGIQNYTY